MSFFSLLARSRKRRRRVGHACNEPEVVFRCFVRALERLRHAPRDEPASAGVMREKA